MNSGELAMDLPVVSWLRISHLLRRDEHWLRHTEANIIDSLSRRGSSRLNKSPIGPIPSGRDPGLLCYGCFINLRQPARKKDASTTDSVSEQVAQAARACDSSSAPLSRSTS